MPGLPLPQHDAASADQICFEQSTAPSSQDEQLTPEESLALYCKPVELSNIIQQRAIKNPYILQRCLLYKIQAKQKKRIQITISLSGCTNAEVQAHHIFPLHVLLARRTSDVLLEGHSPIYHFNRACLVTSFDDSGNNNHTKATFVIPDLKSLATSEDCRLNIILVSTGQGGKNLGENCTPDHMEYSSRQKLGGKCFWGKLPIDLLGSSLKDCMSLSLGHFVELSAKISMSPGFIEPKFLELDGCLAFCSHKVDVMGSYELEVSIYAQEAGASDMTDSPYSCYSYNDVPPSILPHIIRLRAGNVHFIYNYYNNLRKIEVTEDFSCPFCLVRCGSFKGVEYHLTSSHDQFCFEFWLSKDYQAVNVSVKTDTKTELVAAGVDPRNRTFFYCSRFKKNRRSHTINEINGHLHPHIADFGSPEDAQDGFEFDYVQKEDGNFVAQASIHPAHILHGINSSAPTVLQFGKTRKLSLDRADPRNHLLLKKRQFFHSHTIQTMAFVEVLSDDDSEDEVDDDIADFEDRRMLEDFVDVTKDEKHIMHMWNSFVRKQRVLADCHIPWACEAFSRHHGQQLVQSTALLWGWRLFMIKLWNHSLLDACTMNTCNIFLDGFKK